MENLTKGPRTVYAQYKDNNGNESVVYSATITITGDPNPSVYLPATIQGP